MDDRLHGAGVQGREAMRVAGSQGAARRGTLDLGRSEPLCAVKDECAAREREVEVGSADEILEGCRGKLCPERKG